MEEEQNRSITFNIDEIWIFSSIKNCLKPFSFCIEIIRAQIDSKNGGVSIPYDH